jgi:hypothetical protein
MMKLPEAILRAMAQNTVRGEYEARIAQTRVPPSPLNTNLNAPTLWSKLRQSRGRQDQSGPYLLSISFMPSACALDQERRGCFVGRAKIAEHAGRDEKNVFVVISHGDEPRRQYVERGVPGDGLE